MKHLAKHLVFGEYKNRKQVVDAFHKDMEDLKAKRQLGNRRKTDYPVKRVRRIGKAAWAVWYQVEMKD